MGEKWRILFFSVGLLLGGCVSYGVGVFDSHYEFHRDGVAPASFMQPWELSR